MAVRPSQKRSTRAAVPRSGHSSPAAVLALQNTAGNAAVARLLGHPGRLTIARSPDEPTVDPDNVARPTHSQLVTIAQGYIGDWYSAASHGLNDFEGTMADDVDWGPFWTGVMGNVLWATACFITGPASAVAATAGKQFLVSMAGIGIAAAGAGLSVSSKSEFHDAAVEKHLDAVVKELNDQVAEVAASVDAMAVKENWGDNRTRLELLRRLIKNPEYEMRAKGGVPNVNEPAIRRLAQRTLIIQANEVGSAKYASSPGEVIYHYDVTGAEDSGAWYERATVAPTGKWTFKLRKVSVRLLAGGTGAVRKLMRSGKLEPSKMKMRKTLVITAVGSGLVFDDSFHIGLDHNNKVSFVGMAGGIFVDMWEGSPGPMVYAQNAVNRAWTSSGGLPPEAKEFEPFDGY